MADANAKACRVEPLDEAVVEQWVAVTDEQDLFGIDVSRMDEQAWPWAVTVNAAEFIRNEPLQGRLFDAIAAALEKAPGVARAVQEDRERWPVQGQAAGDALVIACAAVLERLEPDLRSAYDAMNLRGEARVRSQRVAALCQRLLRNRRASQVVGRSAGAGSATASRSVASEARSGASDRSRSPG